MQNTPIHVQHTRSKAGPPIAALPALPAGHYTSEQLRQYARAFKLIANDLDQGMCGRQVYHVPEVTAT